MADATRQRAVGGTTFDRETQGLRHAKISAGGFRPARLALRRRDVPGRPPDPNGGVASSHRGYRRVAGGGGANLRGSDRARAEATSPLERERWSLQPRPSSYDRA